MILLQLAQAYRYEKFEQCQLKEFLLSKVTLNETIAHTFFWIVFLEMNNKDNLSDIQDQFKLLYFEFMQKLEIDNERVKISLMEQVSFRERLFELSSHIQKISGVANKKNELRLVVGKNGIFDMHEFTPVPMPLDPSLQVCGVIADKCSVFPSAMCPLKLTFRVTEETKALKNPRVDGDLYNVMYKVGDDVRQDQLVLQMMDLMDFLLKKINYDFKFTIYKVLAFSEDDGMVEFVPKCVTIHAILVDQRTKIENYLKESSKKSGLDYKTVFETYLDSCAGY
jgi:phosphatidylinositol 3-kinase